MNGINRTILLALLSRCQQLVVEDTDGKQNGTTASPSPLQPPSSSATSPRRPYDNAHSYILFVMLFYFFLAATLFKNFIRSDTAKQDDYEESMSTEMSSSERRFNTGPTSERFYFEEENSL